MVHCRVIWQATFSTPEGMEGWTLYRIEYGGHAEHCIIESAIWLPPNFDVEALERLLEQGQAAKEG